MGVHAIGLQDILGSADASHRDQRTRIDIDRPAIGEQADGPAGVHRAEIEARARGLRHQRAGNVDRSVGSELDALIRQETGLISGARPLDVQCDRSSGCAQRAVVEDAVQARECDRSARIRGDRGAAPDQNVPERRFPERRTARTARRRLHRETHAGGRPQIGSQRGLGGKTIQRRGGWVQRRVRVEPQSAHRRGNRGSGIDGEQIRGRCRRHDQPRRREVDVFESKIGKKTRVDLEHAPGSERVVHLLRRGPAAGARADL